MRNQFTVASGIFLVLIFFFAIYFTHNLEAASVRSIPIPKRAYFYHKVYTQIIRSEYGLEHLFRKVREENRATDEDFENFEKVIRGAQINFSKENLIFLSRTERSGSIQVHFNEPFVEGHRVICGFRRQGNTLMTKDMADYGFAFVIDKDITEIEVRVISDLGILSVNDFF